MCTVLVVLSQSHSPHSSTTDNWGHMCGHGQHRSNAVFPRWTTFPTVCAMQQTPCGLHMLSVVTSIVSYRNAAQHVRLPLTCSCISVSPAAVQVHRRGGAGRRILPEAAGRPTQARQVSAKSKAAKETRLRRRTPRPRLWMLLRRRPPSAAPHFPRPRRVLYAQPHMCHAYHACICALLATSKASRPAVDLST